MSSRWLRSQGPDQGSPPRLERSSTVPADTEGGVLRSSARLRTVRLQSSPVVPPVSRPRSRHSISINATSGQPREETTQEDVSREPAPVIIGRARGRTAGGRAPRLSVPRVRLARLTIITTIIIITIIAIIIEKLLGHKWLLWPAIRSCYGQPLGAVMASH